MEIIYVFSSSARATSSGQQNQNHTQKYRPNSIPQNEKQIKSSQLKLKQVQLQNPNSSLQMPYSNHTNQRIQSQHYIYNFKTNISLEIDTRLNVLRLNTILMNNSKPIIVQSSHLKLMLMRHLNKLNSNIRYGHFRIHPQSGILYLTLQSTISTREFRSLVRFFDPIKYNFGEEVYLSECYIEYNIRKILYLIGELDEKLIVVRQNPDQKDGKSKLSYRLNQNQFKEMNLQVKDNNSPFNNVKYSSKIELIIPQVKINPQQQIQIFSLLMKISEVDRYEYSFMYDHTLKKIKPNDQCKKRLKMSQELFKKMQIQSNKIQKLVQNILPFFQFNDQKLDLQRINNSKQYQQQWINQNDRIFIKYLNLPIARVSNPIDNTFLFTDIYILNIHEISRDQIIAEGGFSILYRAKINFIYRTNEIKIDQKSIDEKLILTKMVAIKSSKYSDNKKENHKINHEKAILDQIKDASCVNIVKCYYTQQKQQKSSLFMDFYGYKSLDCYLRYNSVSLVSLMNKIHLLCQTIQGLRFLRDNKIVHLDVKPQNILVGKGLLLRLCDFGESYHPDVCKQDFEPGYTMPYVAPQVFYDNPKYNEKSDVYSLGMVMFELFFHQYPINVKINGREKLEEYYERLEYEIKRNEKIITNPDNYRSYGINKIMVILANICLKCMRTNQDERPYLDWIFIQLRQCLNYLDKVY